MIGASPDGLLRHKTYNEKWPGHGIIEIKCLPSQANQKIDLDKVSYLDKDHKLKRSHTYWTQIQVHNYFKKISTIRLEVVMKFEFWPC